jgi:hypothetical protein
VRYFWICIGLLAALALLLPTAEDPAPPQPTPAEARRTAPSEPAVSASQPIRSVAEAPRPPAPPPPLAAPPAGSEPASEKPGERPGEIAAAAAPPASGDAAPSLELGLDREIPSATVVRGRIERSPDGSLRADGRFGLRGEGTREAPYELSWEYLVSAGESYRPRVGDRGIPQRIALLDGAWVRIEGYVAFPSLESTASEALVMLNRWDGCCIGVPPSPYDAIEVKLASPVARRGLHTIDYGTVLGKLSVEPYLIENWLVGLYLMDDAELRLDL